MPLMFGRVLASGIMVPVNVDLDGDIQIDLLSSIPAGTNNIGDVDVLTLPSIPAGSNLIGDVQSRNKSWVSAAWQKDPLRFGYSASIYRTWENTSLPAGASDQNDSAVPAGEIWVITNLYIQYSGTSPTNITFSIVSGGTAYIMYRILSPVNNTGYDRQGWWVLSSGDNLRASVAGATLNDDLYARAVGFRVDTDQ